MAEELMSFSLTMKPHANGVIKRIFSDFGPITSRLRGRRPSVPVSNAPGKTDIGAFAGRKRPSENADDMYRLRSSQRKRCSEFT